MLYLVVLVLSPYSLRRYHSIFFDFSPLESTVFQSNGILLCSCKRWLFTSDKHNILHNR